MSHLKIQWVNDKKSIPQYASFTLPSPQADTQETWNPTWLQMRPLLGLAALSVTAGAMIASLAILLSSNNKPVHSWPIQPTVYLAIASTVALASLRVAKSFAAPIAWWHRALQGSTIRRLEHHWDATHSPFSAIIRIRHAGWISVVTLTTFVMIIDGALLQRASSVTSTTVTSNVTLNLQLAPELPTGFSGIDKDTAMFQSSALNQIYEDVIGNKALRLRTQGCETKASCSATVLGPGVITHQCNSAVTPINRSMLFDGKTRWGRYHREMGSHWAANPIFVVDVQPVFSPERREREVGRLKTEIAQWYDFEGQFVAMDCIIAPAVLEYDVQLSDGEIIFASSKPQGRLIALVNNTVGPANYNNLDHALPCTLDGFLYFLETLVSANASAVINTPPHKGQYFTPDSTTYNAAVTQYMDFTANATSLVFKDPVSDIVAQLNVMMFRGAILAASWPNITSLIDPGLSPNQTVNGSQTLTETVFQSDLRWFAGAAVLEMVAVIVIVPLFWGWWRLPPNLTQSPLDLALAFDAPLLKNIHSTAGINGALEKIGDMQTAYGVVHSKSSLGMESETSVLKGRLGLGNSVDVTAPIKEFSIFTK